MVSDASPFTVKTLFYSQMRAFARIYYTRLFVWCATVNIAPALKIMLLPALAFSIENPRSCRRSC
jgi:hypothetical protein